MFLSMSPGLVRTFYFNVMAKVGISRLRSPNKAKESFRTWSGHAPTKKCRFLCFYVSGGLRSPNSSFLCFRTIRCFYFYVIGPGYFYAGACPDHVRKEKGDDVEVKSEVRKLFDRQKSRHRIILCHQMSGPSPETNKARHRNT